MKRPSKTNRRVKIYDKYVVRDQHTMGRHHIVIPWLNMSGLWLQDAGFCPGDQVDVQVAQGQLTITKLV
ncbi:SymE family type I addiction module toxin [Hufsiella ginkgonis]|uniref:Type I addiction module toxin, SymE family n=1 Tax=Hufsiella ginkgonis TaxID=2695274 RepID=A0A7K1XUK6_9SPHI|nr:SymE family type I addiction module toxin [Hufsiella ginkgonis]MXV14166.1 type I addiction module toxin, SymE family [Hufsiella ginkgonis]